MRSLVKIGRYSLQADHIPPLGNPYVADDPSTAECLLEPEGRTLLRITRGRTGRFHHAQYRRRLGKAFEHVRQHRLSLKKAQYCRSTYYPINQKNTQPRKPVLPSPIRGVLSPNYPPTAHSTFHIVHSDHIAMRPRKSVSGTCRTTRAWQTDGAMEILVGL